MLPDWHDLLVNLMRFGASDLPISIVEKIVRPMLVYLVLVFALRTFGKRILAQLNPFDLVVLLTLSNTVQNAIIGNDTSLSGGVVGAAALLVVNSALVRWYYRGASSEHRMKENDLCLIENYQTKEKTLQELRINIGELTALAHERGFDDLSEVQTAVLYPNGTIYMKGAEEARDSTRLGQILSELQALRQEVARLRP